MDETIRTPIESMLLREMMDDDTYTTVTEDAGSIAIDDLLDDEAHRENLFDSDEGDIFGDGDENEDELFGDGDELGDLDDIDDEYADLFN